LPACATSRPKSGFKSGFVGLSLATSAIASRLAKASRKRIHFGPGYRVYFTQRGMEVVILLAGGDKSTQSKDIKAALEMAWQL